MLMFCSKFESYLHITGSGIKCCVEHKYAYMQPCRLFFFVPFFPLWHAVSFGFELCIDLKHTGLHSFTQICPGIVLLFWVQGHNHITCAKDHISITKLIQTQTNQRMIWDQENRTDRTDYALSCRSNTITTWFSSHWCRGNMKVEDSDVWCIATAQRTSLKSSSCYVFKTWNHIISVNHIIIVSKSGTSVGYEA